MKPDWKDSPEWASWLAMDKSGEWYWYENEPNIDGDVWALRRGKIEFASVSQYWEYSKEKKRP